MKPLSSYKHIHMIGIGGIGISAIAEICLARGYTVSGSDMNESEMTEKLRSLGAAVYIGHRAEQVSGADLVVYSAAIHEDNPERRAALEQGIPSVSRAEALGSLMMEYAESIAIAGTHGKTTTTSMVSLMLCHANLDPTILVGGNLDEIGGNCRVGKGDYFVAEACEYMDSFLSLRPKTEIILNIDSDHLDYFKDMEHIVRSFDTFAKLLPADGLMIAYSANPFVNSVIQNLPCRVITYGFTEDCDYYAKNISFENGGMPSFDMFFRKEYICRIQLAVPGEHNIANALAAAAYARSMNVSTSVIASTLASFSGTRRRFDVVGDTKSGARIVLDYGHHPTEIKATLKGIGNLPHRDLWVVFQPHTYTRTLALFNDFAAAFDSVDHLILADIYAAREKDIYGVSSEKLANEIKKTHPGQDVRYIKSFGEIAETVLREVQGGDMAIILGAGDVYEIGDKIMALDQSKTE